jgi:hypothetical protein
MNQSESIAKLAAALVKAQSEMPEIPMDGENPHYRSKFSTLGAVIEKVRPVFAANGLAVLQLPSGNNGEVGLTTRIIHSSGEWIENELIMAVPGGANPGQEVGKLVTYLRRYGLASAAGVYSEEDTDNEAKAEKKSAQKPKITAPPTPKSDDEKITPQWMVDNQYADVIAEASTIINYLGIAAKPISFGEPRIRAYRLWRNAGVEAKDAAAKVIAGEVPPEE